MHLSTAALGTLLCGPAVAVTWSSTPATLLQLQVPSLTTQSFEPKVGLDWKMTWGLTTDKLYLAIEAGTTGWVGFGLSEAAGMRGADIMQGHVTSAGAAHVGDFHAVANEAPMADGCQDWTVHHGEEKDGSTLLVVSRKLLTEDSNDRPILASGGLKRQGILAAFGPNGSDDASAYAYHGANKFKFYLDLTSGAAVDQASWSARKAADAALSSFSLKANEGAVPASGAARDDFRAPEAGTGQSIPTARTAYYEYCFPTQAAWAAAGKYLVGFESVSDGSPANVHHLVLYGYDADGCASAATESVVWVGGIGFYEDLPAGVGLPFSRAQSYRLQIHYDNPTAAAGLKDNSGVRLWLSSATPTHEAGTLQLGDGTLQLARTDPVIPQGRSYYTFQCPGSETGTWPVDITVFGSILHMHANGDMMYTEVTTAAGDVVTRPNAVEYFDFAFQDPTMVLSSAGSAVGGCVCGCVGACVGGWVVMQ